jgi:inner membrane protein
LFFWVFSGALSHILSDALNSYGAKIFWPLSKRKHSLSLITITDPVMVLLPVISMILTVKGFHYGVYILAALAVYLASRIIMRIRGMTILKREFGDSYEIERISLLPSMIAGHKFHYIIDSPFSRIVGEIDFLLRKVSVTARLDRIDSIRREHILKSRAAAFFKEFTPIFHIAFEKAGSGYKALLTDLRYMLRGKFLHHATILYDEELNILDEKFNPYSMDTKASI